MSSIPAVNTLVFTDLDGTLLDHDSYQFDEALPAIQFLQTQGIPIIPTTSKTVAEMLIINRVLNNQHPFIAENGCIICFPQGYFQEPPKAEVCDSYSMIKLAPEYGEVLRVLHLLRETESFQFSGFNDMTVSNIAEETGLTIEQSQYAKQRACSEPIIWQSSEAELVRFKTLLARAGLRLIKGGRFWHVLGEANKAVAMQRLISIYAANGLVNINTIALGDSPNDIDMLNEADTAIVIKRKDGAQLSLASSSNVIYSNKPGPAGWNETVLTVLSELQP